MLAILALNGSKQKLAVNKPIEFESRLTDEVRELFQQAVYGPHKRRRYRKTSSSKEEETTKEGKGRANSEDGNRRDQDNQKE